MNFLKLISKDIVYFTIFALPITVIVNYFFMHVIKKNNIFDINEKNSNKKIYTSFGISFVFITLIYLILFVLTEGKDNPYNHIKYLTLPMSIIVIGLIGFWDDFKGTPVHLRLAVFFLCCFLSTSTLNNNLIPFIISHKLQLSIITIFWVYFINASNFLDGGDKFYISFILPNSFFFICYYYYFEPDLLRLKINILVFLFFIHFSFYNRGKKKFFLGDSGSLMFGFIYFWNILNLIEKNDLILVLILSLFILSDVSFTLFMRVINRRNIFTRHKGFLIHVSRYLGRSSRNISLSILLTNFVLVILAIIYKLYFPNIMILILGILTIIIYLSYLIKFDLKNIKYTYLN